MSKKKKSGSIAIPFLLTILISVAIIGSIILIILEKLDTDSTSLVTMTGESGTVSEADNHTVLFVIDLSKSIAEEKKDNAEEEAQDSESEGDASDEESEEEEEEEIYDWEVIEEEEEPVEPKPYMLYLLGYFAVVIGCGFGTGNSYRGHRRGPVEKLQLIFSIVLFAVLVTISVWYYKTKGYTPAFWWNWSFLWTSVYVAKFFCVMGGACPKCKILGVKKLVGSDERKGTATGYVAPGYETVTADIKDESGNKVGTVEAKVHRDGYSYEYNTKTVVRHYHCENCGYDFSES